MMTDANAVLLHAEFNMIDMMKVCRDDTVVANLLPQLQFMCQQRKDSFVVSHLSCQKAIPQRTVSRY